MKSKHPTGSIAWLARAYGAKQVELLQLLGASRQYVHGVERGHFLPSVSYEAKLTHFQEVAYRKLTSPKKKSSVLKASLRDRQASIAAKKLNDVRKKLNGLEELEQAIEHTEQLQEKYARKSLEHDWCMVHIRKLKMKLPKDIDLVRAKLRASEAGLMAEIEYWNRGTET
jgi:DNA-binding XRE family transcriptional regulator